MIQSQFLKYDLVKSTERNESKQRTAQQYRTINKCNAILLIMQNLSITREENLDQEITIAVRPSMNINNYRVEGLLNSNRILSIRSIRITEQQYLKSRSFNLDQFPIKQQQKQRRRSGTDQLSSKQVLKCIHKQLRLNCLYPKTYVTQQEIELAIIKEQQRTKERKKTLLKRMSSILIKNQTVLKNFNTYNRMSQQDIPVLALQKIEVETPQEEAKPSPQPARESQKHLGKKEYKSKLLDLDRVVLSLTKRMKKPCLAIQNYVNERTLSINSINLKIPLQTTKPGYAPNQSLTEFYDQVFSPKAYRKSQIVQGLPEVKFANSDRLHYPHGESYLFRNRMETNKHNSSIFSIKQNYLNQQSSPLSFRKKCRNLLVSNKKRGTALKIDEKS